MIIGNVVANEGSSIWYGATLRGDAGNITIGKQSVVGDLVNIQAKKNAVVSLGDNVYIGPNAYI